MTDRARSAPRPVPRRDLLRVAALAAVLLPAGMGALASCGSRGVLAVGGDWVSVPSGRPTAPAPGAGLVPFAPDGGQAPSWATTAPACTMEYVTLPVRDVVTAEGVYDWAPLDGRLDAVAGRAHRAVVRLWLDTPGSPSGVPRYLIDAGTDTSRAYTAWGNAGASFCPDYGDARIRTMLLSLVEAVGDRYDGDERIAVVQHGLLGFWGEEHTYPYDGTSSADNPDGVSWSPPEELVSALLTAWGRALPTTWHQARYPSALAVRTGAGFHDDSFGHETTGTDSWDFLARLNAAGAASQWASAPIGGEVWPGLDDCALAPSDGCAGLQDDDGADNPLLAAAREIHLSWTIADAWFTHEVPGEQRAHLEELAVGVGAVLRPTRVRLTSAGVDVELTNDGTAPPYWRSREVQARLVQVPETTAPSRGPAPVPTASPSSTSGSLPSASGAPATGATPRGRVLATGATTETGWLALGPGTPLTVRVPLTGVAPEQWDGLRLEARVVDPLPGVLTPVGSAADQDEDGWFLLGVVGS